MGRIGYLLNRPAFQIRRMAQAALDPLGLIPPHMGVLSTLASEGPQTQRRMGERLRIDPTTMVWLVDVLEKKSLVRREEHPEDRRAHLVKLTRAGVALLGRARQRLERMEEEFLAPLSQAERAQLRRLLTKLFKSVTTQSIPPRIFKKEGIGK
jgi:DNA-binding MarR family transcriptional regulator